MIELGEQRANELEAVYALVKDASFADAEGILRQSSTLIDSAVSTLKPDRQIADAASLARNLINAFAEPLTGGGLIGAPGSETEQTRQEALEAIRGLQAIIRQRAQPNKPTPTV